MDEGTSESSCEDRFVSFGSVSRLENIALVSLLSNTWNVQELKKFVSQRYLAHEADTDIEMYLCDKEKKIMDKLEEVLPRKLLDKAGNFVRPMGRQLFRWLLWIKSDFGLLFRSTYIDAVCWKMDGTIDRLKTFELLFENKNRVNESELFYMACHDCNQARVVEIWRKIRKAYVIKVFVGKYFLITYWTDCMNTPGRLTKYHIAAFVRNEQKSKEHLEGSIREGNLEGVKFFWGKLPDRVKSANIVAWTESTIEKIIARCYVYRETSGHTDVMCFFLSQMRGQEQQGEVFRKHSDAILSALFYCWPWQEYLLPTMRAMFRFLSEHVYVDLVSNIVVEIKAGRTTQLLLQQLWCESPLHLKKSFISQFKDSSYVLWRLFKIEDMATIRLILKDASIEEKKQIAFSLLASGNEKVFYGLIYSHNFKFFEMLLEETLLEEKNIVEFKEKLIEVYGEKLCYPWIGEVDWQPLQVILDWCFPTREQVECFEDKIFSQHVALKEAVQKGDRSRIEELLRWCIEVAGDVDMFKAEFSVGFTITELAKGGWNLFEKILKWCFDSSKDIDEYKRNMLRSNDSMFTTLKLMFEKCNFSFAFNLKSWCNIAKEDIKSLKRKFFLSEELREIIEDYITDRRMFNRLYHQWGILRNLAKWFHPMDKHSIPRFQTRLKHLSLLYDHHKQDCEKLFLIIDKLTRDSADAGPYEAKDYNTDDSDDDNNAEMDDGVDNGSEMEYSDDSDTEDNVSNLLLAYLLLRRRRR